MTSDNIIRMARDAGCEVYDGEDIAPSLMRFAALVAAAERTACADICDQHASVEGIAQRCADAIRARNNP